MYRTEIERQIEESFADHAGAESLSSLDIVATMFRVGSDLIRSQCGQVDEIADAAGAKCLELLRSIDMPYVPEFVEVRIERVVVGWMVAEIKRFGHAHCADNQS